MAIYDYLMLTLARGAAARGQFSSRVAGAGLTDGGRVGGLFAPQLGWDAAQAALLVERADGAAAPSPGLIALATAPEVVSHRLQTLRPTLRPRPCEVLKAGGIHVHRWFEVDASALDEFIALSAEAWPDFEGEFDARVFGLFELTSPEPDAAPDSRHLLLVTRYGGHDVWEASRNPSTKAIEAFARRQALTRSTRAASTLLVADPARAAKAGSGAGEHAQAIAAATRCLDDFMAAFNARDLAAHDATFNFPSVRLASNTLVILEAGGRSPEMFARGALADWDHSAWERRRVIHAGPDKVHFDTRFTRYRKDGSVIGGFNSIYVVTCENGHWGVKARSSYAP